MGYGTYDVGIVDGNDATTGAQADAAWSGTGAGSMVAILKALVAHGKSATSQATFTRPANTTAYASGQVVANSTTAANVMTFANSARVVGGTGTLRGVVLVDETNQATKLTPELWLFAGAAAPTTQNDGAAFAPANADIVNLVTVIPFATSYIGNTAATTAGNVVFPTTGLNVPFACGVASSALYGILVARNAYTPISAEVFVCTLLISQD